jgi:hypothetical protein
LPAGTCRNCGSAVSYFARACPQCGAPNQPNPVTTVGALLFLVLVPLAIVLSTTFLWRKSTPHPSTAANVDPATTSVEPKPEAFGWIVQAMAECDVLAKKNKESLYFLIVPVTPSAAPVPGWQPATIGNIGTSASLLASADALVGLRNGALELYRQPLTFAVTDPDTKTVYKWKPAVGVAELKSREITATSLALGIQLGDSSEPQWGPTIAIEKGTCYWTNPLILPGARSG